MNFAGTYRLMNILATDCNKHSRVHNGILGAMILRSIDTAREEAATILPRTSDPDVVAANALHAQGIGDAPLQIQQEYVRQASEGMSAAPAPASTPAPAPSRMYGGWGRGSRFTPKAERPEDGKTMLSKFHTSCKGCKGHISPGRLIEAVDGIWYCIACAETKLAAKKTAQSMEF